MELRILTRFLCAYPVLMALSFYVTWAVGRLTLGYWPRSSLDDPKQIGGVLMELSYFSTGMGMMIGFPVFCALLIILGVVCLFWRREDRGWRLLELVVAVVLMAGFFGFARWDPHSVVEWYFD